MARLRRGTPGLIRDLNRSAVLGLIGEAPIARVEIARQLRLSQATVTEVTRELVDTGLVQVVDQGPSSGGRPPLLLGIVAGAAQALGVKISADHLALVRVSLDGEILASASQPFDPQSDGALDIIASSLTALVPRGGTAKLLGIGLGVPGLVDGHGNVEAPIFGWHGFPLGPTLRQRLRLPILIDNDVNTLAVAERLYGRGRGVDHFLTVTIGRGVGLGIIIGGDLYRGWLGGAGEFGHVAVTDGGPPCECGKRGCLEALVADPALILLATEVGLDLPAGEPAARIAALRALAERGEERALSIYAQAGATFGRAVAGLVNVLNPQLIVISGEGTLAWPYLAEAFEVSLRQAAFPPLRDAAVEVDPWDDAKWARGAAALVLRATFAAPLYERQFEDAVRDQLPRRRRPALDSEAGVPKTDGAAV
jgi:predicted NBD/HSP70 family sugar kinase